MRIRSEFKVDLFQMKHARDPEGLLRTIKDVNAATLGRKLVEYFPYERTDSYTGVLPEMSMNRDHEFNDTYGVELVVMRRGQFDLILSLLPPEIVHVIKEKAL
jgi:hypothetical protein